MVLAQQADQGLARRQARRTEQGRERPVAHQHRRPFKREGAGHEPGHQAGGGAAAEAHHGRAFAVAGVLLHLVEVGAEQHQGGGQGRAAAQANRRAPGHGEGLSRRRQGHEASGGGQRAKGDPAEGLAQALVTEPKRRPLVGVADAAAGQHQGEHRRTAA